MSRNGALGLYKLPGVFVAGVEAVCTACTRERYSERNWAESCFLDLAHAG
jgi:hypothetical protein